jgi:cytochrome b561
MRSPVFSFSRLLHWAIAIFVLGALASGYATTRFETFSLTLLRFHLGLGVTAGALSLIRVVQWLTTGAPERVFPIASKAQNLASSLVHAALRLLPLLLLISGIGMIALSGAFSALINGSLTNLTGFAELPPRSLHHAAALLLASLIALHTIAAGWHSFRQPTLKTE